MFRNFALAALVLSPCITAHASCEPTPQRSTGTHYEPVTEQRETLGSGLIVHGRVLAMPDCRPIAGARVAHWQAGENGRYQDRLRAYRFTDAEGRFRFSTEWPNLRPPHIHFIVTVDGHPRLETQWVGTQRQKEIEFDMVLAAPR